jgi:protease-4
VGLTDTQALTVQVKLGLLPADLALDALPAGAAAGVAKDLSWLSQVASRRQPFAAVTHCLCEIP